MRRIDFSNATWKNSGVALSLAGLLFACATLAQSSGPYVLAWSTIDGGGGTSKNPWRGRGLNIIEIAAHRSAMLAMTGKDRFLLAQE